MISTKNCQYLKIILKKLLLRNNNKCQGRFRGVSAPGILQTIIGNCRVFQGRSWCVPGDCRGISGSLFIVQGVFQEIPWAYQGFAGEAVMFQGSSGVLLGIPEVSHGVSRGLMSIPMQWFVGVPGVLKGFQWCAKKFHGWSWAFQRHSRGFQEVSEDLNGALGASEVLQEIPGTFQGF